MKFQKLNEIIPYVTGGKNYILSMQPYNAVSLAMPGRHAKDTDPIGGDFVVMVDDADLEWIRHKFTHSDIFADVQRKHDECPEALGSLMDAYYEVVLGADPEKFLASNPEKYVGLHPHTFLFAVQALAVAEHRRYARFEKSGGGKFLPLRFSAGIAEGLWTATDAASVQRKGRPGCEMLERLHGRPSLTRELAAK